MSYIQKKLKKITLTFSFSPLLALITSCAEPQRSLSQELGLPFEEFVGWRTGCPVPDMSNTKADGSISFTVFVNKDGSTKRIILEKSTGTAEDNREIISTLSTCNFTDPENIYHNHKYKRTLIFDWKKKDHSPPLTGIRRCLIVEQYPRLARLKKEEGEVIISIQLESGSNEFLTTIKKSSNSRILDNKAMQAAKKCLDNEIVAESVRNKVKNGATEEFGLYYSLGNG